MLPEMLDAYRTGQWPDKDSCHKQISRRQHYKRYEHT